MDPGVDEQGQVRLPEWWVEVGGKWVVLVAIPVFYVALYRIAQLWVKFVDPWCARCTNWIEEVVCAEEGRGEKSLLLQ